MNEIQDKQYLALELTKMMFQNTNNAIDRTIVFENYNYFLNELIGALDKGETIMQLQMEIETLQRKLNERIITNPWGNINLGMLRKVINDGKGDMEPYLYDAIIKIIGE